ncbi:Uncharacterised protein [Candidatus Tiddalikarchaeum anstoanum]|nr:Uncharacterised protein [Candidatus Tiddalikarchaeum anstoanum]
MTQNNKIDISTIGNMPIVLGIMDEAKNVNYTPVLSQIMHDVTITRNGSIYTHTESIEKKDIDADVEYNIERSDTYKNKFDSKTIEEVLAIQPTVKVEEYIPYAEILLYKDELNLIGTIKIDFLNKDIHCYFEGESEEKQKFNDFAVKKIPLISNYRMHVF